MRIRFGYVANAMNLQDCSPSKAVTATNLVKIKDLEGHRIKLTKIARENLNNTLRILKYNAAYEIKIYRMTSKLIPLATHPITEGWDYLKDLAEDFRRVGNFAIENDMRVSSHPDHFTLLNSPREEVFKASLNDLDYHEKIFTAMGLDKKAKMVLHIGGFYNDKVLSVERFITNYKSLDQNLKSRIILENDDKIYTAKEVLEICKILNIPMVLDIHHDKCNKSSEDITQYVDDIFRTWEGTGLPPKLHLSSSKNEKEFRSHADYINKDDFLTFLYKTRGVNKDFDVMIEAKTKDLALLKLMEEIKGVKGIEIINGAEIEY